MNIECIGWRMCMPFGGWLTYRPRPGDRCGECAACARDSDGHDPGDEDRSER